MINIVISLLVFSFVAINTPFPLFEVFISIFIISNFISLFCNISGYFLGKLLNSKTAVIRLPVILSGALIAAMAGIVLSNSIVLFLFNYPIFQVKTGYFIPALLIALIVTTIAVFVNRLQFSKEELEKSLDEIKLEKEVNSDNYSLSVKEGEKYHMIKCDDLIYLSARGKKTILHTNIRDFEANQLIKNFESKLSEHFIRIHRQFIINTKYLAQVKYYEGGRYMAYLNDEDESALPIGKKMTPLLKEKLGI